MPVIHNPHHEPHPLSAHTQPIPIPVVILNWNGLADTCRCLDHLIATEGVAWRAVVVDNGSDQPTDLETLQAQYGNDARIKVQANPSNLGFAAGMNQVLQALLTARSDQAHEPVSDYVALLNNDAFVEPTWLAALLECAQATKAGAVASCMLRDDDPKKLDNAGHVFLNTGEVLPRGSQQSADDFQQRMPVAGACAGACLLRLDMLEDIGLFDPFYTTGYEDAELGLRAMLAGWPQVYEPKARVRHKIGASIDKIRDLNYAITLQTNIHYAYFKLMPKGVIAWNLPWLLIKTLVLLLVPVLTARWRLARVHWLATWRSLGLLPDFIRARRQPVQRRISRLAIVQQQEFFIKRYVGYFVRFVWRRQPTIFER